MTNNQAAQNEMFNNAQAFQNCVSNMPDVKAKHRRLMGWEVAFNLIVDPCFTGLNSLVKAMDFSPRL